jgi:integrase/recombinase XerD
VATGASARGRSSVRGTHRARTVVAVRGLHRYLRAEEDAPGDAAAGVAAPSPEASLPRPLSVEDVGRLLDGIGDVQPAWTCATVQRSS